MIAPKYGTAQFMPALIPRICFVNINTNSKQKGFKLFANWQQELGSFQHFGFTGQSGVAFKEGNLMNKETKC